MGVTYGGGTTTALLPPRPRSLPAGRRPGGDAEALVEAGNPAQLGLSQRPGASCPLWARGALLARRRGSGRGRSRRPLPERQEARPGLVLRKGRWGETRSGRLRPGSTHPPQGRGLELGRPEAQALLRVHLGRRSGCGKEGAETRPRRRAIWPLLVKDARAGPRHFAA